MRSIIVFCLLLATNLQALKAKDKIQVEDVYVPPGFCPRPQVNDHVTVDYNFKMDKLTERLALKIHMGHSQYPELENIIMDMCKGQRSIAKIPAKYYYGLMAPKGKYVELELMILQIGEGQSREDETFEEVDLDKDDQITHEELMHNMHVSEFHKLEQVKYANPENGTKIAEELLKRLINRVDFYFKLYDKDESGALSRQELVHLNKARTEL